MGPGLQDELWDYLEIRGQGKNVSEVRKVVWERETCAERFRTWTSGGNAREVRGWCPPGPKLWRVGGVVEGNGKQGRGYKQPK